MLKKALLSTVLLALGTAHATQSMPVSLSQQEATCEIRELSSQETEKLFFNKEVSDYLRDIYSFVYSSPVHAAEYIEMSSLHEKFKALEVVVENNSNAALNVRKNDLLKKLAPAHTPLMEILKKYPQFEIRKLEHHREGVALVVLAVCLCWTVIMPFLLLRHIRREFSLKNKCEEFMKRVAKLARTKTTIYAADGSVVEESVDQGSYCIPAGGGLRELVIVHMPTLRNAKLIAKSLGQKESTLTA